MEDVAPALFKRLDRLYKSGINSDAAITRLLGKESKNYLDAFDYAERAGGHASRAFETVLTKDALPDGKMYYNIAQRTVRPILEEVYENVADYCVEAQAALNEAAKIGIKAIKPDINDDRIVGMIDRLTEAESIEDINWMLDSPVENFAMSIIDNAIKKNAQFHYEAGLRPVIIRRARGKCCEWCQNLEGVHDYPVEDEMVFHRHKRCRCTNEYDPGNGRRQDVWGSKKNRG